MKHLILVFYLVLQSCMTISVDDPVPNVQLETTEENVNEVIDISEKANCREARKIDLKNNYKKALSDLFDTGRCYSIQNKYPLATRFFNLVLSNSKNQDLNRKTYLELAHIKLKKEHDKEAMTFMRKAQGIRRTLEVSYQMSEIYLKYGAYDRALSEMKSYVGQIDSRVLRIHGIAYLLQGNISKSLDFFGQIPRIQAQDSTVKLHYAWALTLNKQYPKAKALMGQVRLDSKSHLFELQRRVASELDKIVIKPRTGDKDA